MNPRFEQLINESNEIHIPLPHDERDTMEYRLERKPVLENRVIDGCETMDNWSPVTEYAKVEVSGDYSFDGKHSIKFSHPTNLDDWIKPNRGRIYAEPAAMCKINREDWSEWNRLSVWVYPIADGIKSITVRLQLYNDGVRKVPDIYQRDGHHNVNVENRKWNHIVLEIPYLDRDAVTGVAVEYDMVGHEPDAVDEIQWYIDKLELQKVDADTYETWVPMKGRIAYSHSGYQPGSVKMAVISDANPKTFKLVETETGRLVLEKEIMDVDAPVGKMRVLDFTEIMEKGHYMLIAGDIMSRVFAIDENVWEISLWKTLNFFLVLRCGYEVPGKHRACHSDMLLKNGDEAIVCNGGWHDAADLAQGMHNTAEATTALLALASVLKGRNERLYKRVLEEAKWGLDYVLKTRFSDGSRNSYSSSSIWTDGIIGTKDDIISRAAKNPWVIFDCAYAEAMGAKLFKDIDPDYSRYCLKTAKEDFKYAEIFIEEQKNIQPSEPPFGQRRRLRPEGSNTARVNSLGSMAASALFAVTKDSFYEERAVYYTDTLLSCQQQAFTDWDVPMTGFFYHDTDRDLIWHHSHMSYSCMPDIALKGMCDTFPKHGSYMKWYHALALSSEYYKTLVGYTQPYGVIPAGVYHEDEMENHLDKVLSTMNQVAEEDYPLYKVMAQKGFPVGKGHYIRVFPVWFSFRGNYKVLLNESKSMSTAALLRNDYDLYNSSQDTYQWIVGKNPFGQSTMYGEGYDYAQLYAVQPGQTVGALGVGMQSKFEGDIPYWPQVNTATYKEVWVCPPTRWMWCMADNHLPAVLSGYINRCGGCKNKIHDCYGCGRVFFTHKAAGNVFTARRHPRTGYFEISLPAGFYSMAYGGIIRDITVISGKNYTFDGAMYVIETGVVQNGGDVTIQINARTREEMELIFEAENLTGYEKEFKLIPDDTFKANITITAVIKDSGKPWIGLLTPQNNPADTYEILDTRLK